MAYADTIRTTDYTREELANLIDGNRFVGEAVTTGGTAPNYTVTLTPAPSAYATGQIFPIRIHSNLTTTSGATLNVNGLGAKNLEIGTRGNPTRQVNPYELSQRQVYYVAYDGTDDLFRVLNPTPTGDVAFTPTVSVPSGTLSVTYALGRYSIIGDRVLVSYNLRLGLSGATAAYIDVTLPFNCNSGYLYHPITVYHTSVAGASSYSAISSFSSASTLSVYRSDSFSDFPIDSSFFIRALGTYKADI